MYRSWSTVFIIDYPRLIKKRSNFRHISGELSILPFLINLHVILHDGDDGILGGFFLFNIRLFQAEDVDDLLYIFDDIIFVLMYPIFT